MAQQTRIAQKPQPKPAPQPVPAVRVQCNTFGGRDTEWWRER